MSLSEESIKEFQEIYKKNEKELLYEEASVMAHKLEGLAKLCYDIAIRQCLLDKKLEKFPKGFHLEADGHSCIICRNSIPGEQAWYDKYGIKCPICQKAIDKKIVPPTITNDNTWYSNYDLEHCFNINRHVLKRFIKEGIFKPRIIPDETGKPHVQLFLIKDNRGTLPPKKLVESHMVKETTDGKSWFHMEPWYRMVNDPYKHLEGYKIMDYLKITHEEK